jgi:hypothetical protein
VKQEGAYLSLNTPFSFFLYPSFLTSNELVKVEGSREQAVHGKTTRLNFLPYYRLHYSFNVLKPYHSHLVISFVIFWGEGLFSI